MPVFQPLEPQVVPDIGSTPQVHTGAEAIGQGVSNLGAGIQDFGIGVAHLERRMNEIQTQNNEFDDQAKYRTYIQDRQNALDDAKRNMPANATGFTQSFIADQAKANQAFLQTISPQNQKHFQEQLGAVDSNFHGLAVDAEMKGRSDYETNNVQQAYVGYQSTIRQHPDQRDAAQADLYKSIDAMTSATPEQKIEMKQKIDSGMAFQQALGEAGNDPAKMKTLVWGSQSGGASAGSGDVHNNVLLAAVSKGEGAGDYNKVFANGQFGNTPKPVTQMTVDEAAQWADQHRHKNNPDNPHPAAPLGAYQFVGSTINALKNQMGLKGNELMSPQLQDAMAWQNLKNTRGNPEAIRQQWTSWAGKSDAEIHALWEQGFKQHEGKAAPSDYPTGGPAAAGALNEDKAGVPPSSIAPDSRFSSLTPEQRDSLVETAGRNLTAQTSATNAAAVEQQKSLVNDLSTGIINNQTGISDIKQRLDNRQITAEQYNSLAGQIEKRDSDSGSAADFWSATSNGQSLNPYSEKDKKSADAAFKQAGGDVAALDKVYSASGNSILPASGVAALRGGLVSTNPQVVGQALTIAANAITRNPNAFTGAEGGSDIEKQALTYQHYVNDLQMPAAQAAQKIAQQNTPEYKSKLPPDTQVEDFSKSITPDTIAKQFSGWLPGSTPKFGSSPDQQSEMLRDYKEAALDAYKSNGGDAALAQQQAYASVNKVWGVTNVLGTQSLVKYPIEKTYPPVNEDPSGPYSYITAQAGKMLRDQAGQLVLPQNMIIAPIPNVTAQAYLKGDHAPYMLGYQAPDENGFMQVHMLPSTFTPNPEDAHRQATQFIQPQIDQMNQRDLQKQQDLQTEQNFQQQRYNTMNPSEAAPNRREWPGPPDIKATPAPAAGAPPSSGSDAFQQQKKAFEEGPGQAFFGSSGVGM